MLAFIIKKVIPLLEVVFCQMKKIENYYHSKKMDLKNQLITMNCDEYYLIFDICSLDKKLFSVHSH